jgi:hypothetical protein
MRRKTMGVTLAPNMPSAIALVPLDRELISLRTAAPDPAPNYDVEIPPWWEGPYRQDVPK